MNAKTQTALRKKGYQNPTDAAKLTGVHKLTILRWIRAGKLPAFKIGRGYFIADDDLRAAFPHITLLESP